VPVLSRELQPVDVGRRSLDAYAEVAGEDAVSEIRKLADPLRGLRVLYVSGSSYAGAAAEQLRSLVPLLVDAGVDATWAVMFGEPEFHEASRQIHDAMQGGEFALSDNQWRAFLDGARANAGALSAESWDAVVIHDPQPLPLIEHADREDAPWVWRCHLDASDPDPEAWAHLRRFAERFDATVFSMPQFVPPDLPSERLHIVPPGIDPLSPRNVDLPWKVCGQLLRWVGLDLERPMIANVFRLDPWKDPLGVIEAWRIAREDVPELQLALVGALGAQDTEAWRIHKEITDFAEAEADLHVFTDYSGVGRVEVNAFQRVARCQVQRSIREGFGLVASEALWKETPVVAEASGGLPAQVRDGSDGFLISSSEEMAARIVELVSDPGRALELGKSGKEHVRSRFLVTRLLADELRLLAEPGQAG
jgi:trehalose synthase